MATYYTPFGYGAAMPHRDLKPDNMRSTLHEILDRGGFSPTTRRKYEMVIDRWLAFAGGHPSGWTRPQAQEFYDELLRSGVTPRSAHTYMNSLRYVSRWYAIRESNPQLDFAVVQMQADQPTIKREALTEHEARAIIEPCLAGKSPIDRRDLVMIVVGLETGMRRMSLLGMRVENLGIQNHYPMITVPIKGPGGSVPFAVPLSDTAHAVITSWRVWLTRHGMKNHGPILPRIDRRVDARGATQRIPDKERAIGFTTAADIMEDRAKAAGLRHLHPHLLRNTFITWRDAAGLTGVQIAAMTGHKALPDGYRSLAPYLDMKTLAAPIRNATPPWLADLVKDF